MTVPNSPSRLEYQSRPFVDAFADEVEAFAGDVELAANLAGLGKTVELLLLKLLPRLGERNALGHGLFVDLLFQQAHEALWPDQRRVDHFDRGLDSCVAPQT